MPEFSPVQGIFTQCQSSLELGGGLGTGAVGGAAAVAAVRVVVGLGGMLHVWKGRVKRCQRSRSGTPMAAVLETVSEDCMFSCGLWR